MEYGAWVRLRCVYVQHALKCFSVPNSNRRRRRDRNSVMRARMRYRKLHNLLNTYDEYAHAYLYKCLCVATNKNLQHKMMSAFSKSDACAYKIPIHMCVFVWRWISVWLRCEFCMFVRLLRSNNAYLCAPECNFKNHIQNPGCTCGARKYTFIVSRVCLLSVCVCSLSRLK